MSNVIDATGLFSLDYINDLPEKMQNDIKEKDKGRNGLWTEVYALFELMPELMTRQLVVGYYRKYKKDMSRQKMNSVLNYIRHQKKLITFENGAWKKVA